MSLYIVSWAILSAMGGNGHFTYFASDLTHNGNRIVGLSESIQHCTRVMFEIYVCVSVHPSAD